MLKSTIIVVLALVCEKSLAAQVDVTRKELLVLPGQNATFMCRVGVPLQYCRIEIPGFRTYNLNRGSVDNDVAYFGEGLDAGQCGFTINRVEEINNGDVKCTLGIPSEPTESIGTMQLVVARAPKTPELDTSRGIDFSRIYKAGDFLEASCLVRDGRPVANISWYLDDEPLSENSLNIPTVIDLATENLQSKVQNLSKTLYPSDNGKFLRCVAWHPAYPDGFAETKQQLDVKFSPIPSEEQIIDKFGYKIGQDSSINYTFAANPKPYIEWIINGETVHEGSTDRSGRIEAESLRDLGKSLYLANLKVRRIKKEDTEFMYILRASNDLGPPQDYQIKISTSAEPENLAEFGIGEVIGIVVVVLFIILVIFVITFAKVTRRWCFSDRESDSRNLGESSDTESAVMGTETKPISLSLVTKNKNEVPQISPEVKTEESSMTKNAEPEIEATQVENIDKSLVYAELDLVKADLKPVVKSDDEKTEYAEIVYTPSTTEKTEEESTDNKRTEKQ